MQKIAELGRRGAAGELGYKNVAHVLRHAVRWDLKTARQWVARAALLAREVTPTGSVLEPELPATAAAVADGALSAEHISAVAEVMKDLPPEAEQPVVEFALAHEPSAVRSFAKELAYRLYQQDAESRETEPRLPVNKLRMEWKGEQLEVWARLDKVSGAKFEAMIDPLAKPRSATPEEGPDPRSRAERQGDAFADLIDLMLRADQLPEHGGEPVTLTLTMAYADLAEKTGLALLDSRERVPAALVRRLACNAGVIPVVMGGRSEPMDIGRKSRTLPRRDPPPAGRQGRRLRLPRLRPASQALRRPPRQVLVPRRRDLGWQRGAAVPPPPHLDPPERWGSGADPRHAGVHPARVAGPCPHTQNQRANERGARMACRLAAVFIRTSWFVEEGQCLPSDE
ncbi:DUF222 domain-containing protein [Lentzea sp. NEAU-D13]|uniref:DUF222 domain-containing protein n=1 Tax=Lentzea alba TaxID=2714351 RepID=A0A7C9W3E5_9PSEU|nr:DUF222 domain-containing protein [Lentzea alba]